MHRNLIEIIDKALRPLIVKNDVPQSQGKRFAVVDTEVSVNDKKVRDIGGWRSDGAIFHRASKSDLVRFLSDVDFVCGHNIVHHDARYLFDEKSRGRWALVDTLYLSPLLFPKKPYHRLVKNDKLVSDDVNNPVNDSLKARDLFLDEVGAWRALSPRKQCIYTALLGSKAEFSGFLRFVDAQASEADVAELIKAEFATLICVNADIAKMVKEMPVELAYALAVVDTSDSRSVTPGWVLVNFPKVEHVINLLRNRRCSAGCDYCNSRFDIKRKLNECFGYSDFRTYNGEPLQENAVQAAVDGKSLLAIFPTGGGKSLTFQLPALMAGDAVHGLTVVISPLQSLMKDQVDTLVNKGITGAETINGMLDPIARSQAIQRVADGEASILYISPEMLRSKTIERILQSRHVVRFVIDEAHCFSSWGQDFRVDYLYIGRFIKEYIEKKGLAAPIPVSCFTATAKQKVIQDICDYFRSTVGLDLKLFTTSATRTNLRYSVVHVDSDDDKYVRLRQLVSEAEGPAIVYVSRTKRTYDLAGKLSRDGYRALPFNGKMESDQKAANQDAFMRGDVDVIVATSAFGMGVDKSDVRLVVHYDISDSLENYIQEAGRAGRDPNLSARCFVLYNDSDLDKHFILLNQTKLSFSEIQQVWKAVKTLTKQRESVGCSALEIARQAGWDDSVNDIETRVRTALATLEQAGYLKRGSNIPHVYATGITVKNVDEARMRITASDLFDQADVEKAVRIIKSLISQKYVSRATDGDAESRVDYLADILGLTKADVISVVDRMRLEGILADSKDISAYINDHNPAGKKSMARLNQFAQLESCLLDSIPEDGINLSYKQINDNAVKAGLTTSKEKDIRTLLYFLTIKGYIHKTESYGYVQIKRQNSKKVTVRRHAKRIEICRLAIEYLHGLAKSDVSGASRDCQEPDVPNRPILFSETRLFDFVKSRLAFFLEAGEVIKLDDIEEALLYLSKTGVLKLDGGFLVIYNAMRIKRLKEAKYSFKQADYRMLDEFYKMKIQQVHIVGEYANLMVRDYEAALRFVSDYFQLDYKRFIAKYFKGDRTKEINLNLTPQKYRQLFGDLSDRQKEIINDKESRCLVVAAGPGSGKTRVLVHKLASLLMLEDVKHEQLLMLTFSRAAATEFKQRLIDLIGNAAHFVEIKTFHAYCFDLLGRIGNLEDAKNVLPRATEMIVNGDVEPNRISKSVLVIDEAQDMGAEEFALVRALMDANEEMRVIAVGDDDQGIFEFRGSDSDYMYKLAQLPGSRLMEMTQNYRSSVHVVEYANRFVKKISHRLKSKPIVSMSERQGSVEIVQYQSKNMSASLVREVANRRSEGSSCVLTHTNDEAALIVGLLKKQGVKCSLIQSMSGFRFWNMAETRYFLKYIDKRIKSPVIPDNLWNEAIEATRAQYHRSCNMAYLNRCIDRFAKITGVKYMSDFNDFVFESTVEDFCDSDSDAVVVSTIHKAKGREYDDVYMLVDRHPGEMTHDSNLRALYVGITRAKKRLFIHTDCEGFKIGNPDRYAVDETQYDVPNEIVLQLGHRDVFLNFFKGIKRDVLALRGGDMLKFENMTLYDMAGHAVVKLSASMQSTLNGWFKKGYRVKSASVRFIVAWKAADAPKKEAETAVLLPDLVLVRE